MRYILKDGYIDEISFGATIECKNQTCTEYTGLIPSNYSSLEEWVIGEEEKINAWKIEDGNLVFDNARYDELQNLYNRQKIDNSCVTHKEIEELSITNSKELKDLYERKNSMVGKVINILDSANFSTDKINIKPLETITDKIDLVVNGVNMLPNDFTTFTKDNVEFKQNKDKSISIDGAVLNNIEVTLSGSDTSIDYILTFKKNIKYILSGLCENVKLKFYCYDGTDREFVLTSGNGIIEFDTDKHITQITLSIELSNILIGDKLNSKKIINNFPENPTKPIIVGSTLRNVQVGDDLSGKTIYCSFHDNFGDNLISLAEQSFSDYNANVITASKTIYEYGTAGSSFSSGGVNAIDYTNALYYEEIWGEEHILSTNLTSYELPSDFGVVTSIDTSSFAYQYIFVAQDEVQPVETNLIEFENGTIVYKLVTTPTIEEKIYLVYNSTETNLYLQNDYVVSTNLDNYKLPKNIGSVTNINDNAAYKLIKKQIDIDDTIYPMLNVGTASNDYEPYTSNKYTIDLSNNTVSKQVLYPNMVYPSDNVYPGVYQYITIEDGKVTLFTGNTETDLNDIEQPVTFKDKSTIYTHQDTEMMIKYRVTGAIAPKNIKLEGYTTINGGFSVDLEGNMICNNATITGGNIDGAYLNLSDEGGNENAGITIKNKNSVTDGECLLSSNMLELDGNGHLIFISTANDFFETSGTEFADFDGKFKIYNNGNAYLSGSLTQGSLKELKKNFEKFDGGLEIIKNADIYKYNYKAEEDNYKKHIGLVIGDNYNTPTEILNNENTGVDTYSMVSVCFNAIKQLNSKIEELENRIKELESDK